MYHTAVSMLLLHIIDWNYTAVAVQQSGYICTQVAGKIPKEAGNTIPEYNHIRDGSQRERCYIPGIDSSTRTRNFATAFI